MKYRDSPSTGLSVSEGATEGSAVLKWIVSSVRLALIDGEFTEKFKFVARRAHSFLLF